MISSTRMALAMALLTAPAMAQSTSTQATYGVVGRFAISWAYPSIKLDSAYIRGWTGKGVTVAVFDTGVNASSSKFAGNIAGRGYDVYAPGAAVTTDPNWHGTFVSSIIAANRTTPSVGNTMYGVAYDAKILPIKIMDSRGLGTFSDQQLANGIDYATAGGAKVFNNSWNTNITLTELGSQRSSLMAMYPKQIAAWERASARGVVNVWAAGNDGKSDPGFFASLPNIDAKLAGNWIVVVAADTTGKIANWSNRCGISASYCITAPGQDIVGVYQNGIATASGTSFAAPLVSGGVALLIQQWPYLTGAQITSILFQTANKKGIYADSKIYGNGYMDLDAATRPLGTIKIPTGSTIAGTALPASSVTLAPGIGRVSTTGISDIMLLDEYDRAFNLPARYLITEPDGSMNLDAAYAKFSGGQVVPTNAGTARVSFGMDGNDAVGINSPGVLPSMGIPFLSMGESAKITLHDRYFTLWGNETGELGQAQQHGMMLNWSELHVGLLHETNGVWGMAGSDLGSDASTLFAAYQDDLDLGRGWKLQGGVSYGITRTSGTKGLVDSVSDLHGIGANLGISKRGWIRTADEIGIGISLPYHSIYGSADMRIPVARDMDGNISYSNESVRLVSDSMEKDIQAWWSNEFNQAAVLKLSAGLRISPNGNSQLPTDTVTMARLNFAF